MRVSDLFTARTIDAIAKDAVVKSYAKAYDRHIADKVQAMQRRDTKSAEEHHAAAVCICAAYKRESRG